VEATLDELQGRATSESRNLAFIVERVRPSVKALLDSRRIDDREALLDQASRANVRASVDQLRHGSDILEQLVRTEGLLIVGAEYSLETGVVDFFDGVPAGG
jgi:carbonic anhydrase